VSISDENQGSSFAAKELGEVEGEGKWEDQRVEEQRSQ